MDEPYVDARAISDLLTLSVFTVRQHAKAGTIPAHKIGNQWRFRISEVKAHLERPVDAWQQSAASRGRRRAS